MKAAHVEWIPRNIAARLWFTSGKVMVQTTNSGTGTVRTWPPFPTRSTLGPTVLAPPKMVETEVGQFSPSENTAEQDRNDRSVSLTFERFDVGRLPQSTRFILRTTSFQAGHRVSFTRLTRWIPPASSGLSNRRRQPVRIQCECEYARVDSEANGACHKIGPYIE